MPTVMRSELIENKRRRLLLIANYIGFSGLEGVKGSNPGLSQAPSPPGEETGVRYAARMIATRQSLNAVYTKPSMQRRYEVWFLRLGLADGSGAWWFRYLLMNPGRNGCAGHPRGMPVQVWATQFPAGGTPHTFIEGFPREPLELSAPRVGPFHFQVGENSIGEDSCAGHLAADGHEIRWNLTYRSTCKVSMSDKSWIGFSRTPHSDAVFSGEIIFDGATVRGEPLGLGVQGHNCGYRHRNLWNWTHCIFSAGDGSLASFEALEYEMPLRAKFRRALLWTDGKLHEFKQLREMHRDPANLRWEFVCANPRDRSRLVAAIDGSGPSLHRLPYLKTDCSGTFEVSNNSLARAKLELSRAGQPLAKFWTNGGAVLEMAGP